MFYYKAGEIETNVKWDRPSKNQLIKFWKELKNINSYLNEYECYLVGAVVHGIKTWDVDIILRGEENYVKIKSILNDAFSIGHNNKLLIDIKYSNILFDTPEENLNMPQHYVIRNFNETYKNTNGKIKEKKWNGKEIYPGLFKTEVKNTNHVWEWTKKQYKEGKYKGKNNIKIEKYLYL